jgi:hypothetical protein
MIPETFCLNLVFTADINRRDNHATHHVDKLKGSMSPVCANEMFSSIPTRSLFSFSRVPKCDNEIIYWCLIRSNARFQRATSKGLKSKKKRFCSYFLSRIVIKADDDEQQNESYI